VDAELGAPVDDDLGAVAHGSGGIGEAVARRFAAEGADDAYWRPTASWPCKHSGVDVYSAGMSPPAP